MNIELFYIIIIKRAYYMKIDLSIYVYITYDLILKA